MEAQEALLQLIALAKVTYAAFDSGDERLNGDILITGKYQLPVQDTLDLMDKLPEANPPIEDETGPQKAERLLQGLLEAFNLIKAYPPSHCPVGAPCPSCKENQGQCQHKKE